jgi:TorA maturation chaperone TorD
MIVPARGSRRVAHPPVPWAPYGPCCSPEPEDHAAILCELMAGLAGGQIAAPAETEREIFETHLLPWIGRFFADLERAESADFYAGVGAVGRTFVDIETKAFTLPASGQVL